MRKFAVVAVVIAACVLWGCAKNVGVHTPQTPEQKVSVYAAEISEANLSISKVTRSLADGGVLPKATASQILTVNDRVAAGIKAVIGAVQGEKIPWDQKVIKIRDAVELYLPAGRYDQWIGITKPEAQQLVESIKTLEAAIRLLAQEVAVQ